MEPLNMLGKNLFPIGHSQQNIERKIDVLKTKSYSQSERLKDTFSSVDSVETQPSMAMNSQDYYDTWDYYDFDNLIEREIESFWFDE
jgi:hypothetical protein